MLNTNIGIFHDMIYILTRHFNSPLQTKWIDLNNVSETIRLFFCNYNNSVFMEQFLENSLEELLKNENLQVIQDKIMDCENTVNSVKCFYFNDALDNFTLNNYEFIRKISKNVAALDCPAEVKTSLYSFFIEPTKVIHELMRTFLDLYSQISQMHQNHISTISRIQNEISDVNISEKLKILGRNTKKLFLAVCLLDSEYIKTVNLKDTAILFLGQEYKKSFELSNDVSLKDFGYALTETNRLKILNMMNEFGEISIKDIEQELKLSGTNAYYHLSLMIKTGMVKTRNKGRTVFYSIDKTYFKTICSRLSIYYK